MDTNSTAGSGSAPSAGHTPLRVAGFRMMLGLAVVAALAAVVVGGWVVVADLRVSGEFLDGVGVVIGLVVAGAGVLAGVLAVVACAVARSRPRTARVIGVLLALAGLAVAYPLGVDTGIGYLPALASSLLLVLAVLPDDRLPEAEEPRSGRGPAR